eukprot:318776-Prymnesium_polylepis.1
MVACAAPHVCASSCGAVGPNARLGHGVSARAAAAGVSWALLVHHVTCMMEIAESIAEIHFEYVRTRRCMTLEHSEFADMST